MMTKIKNYLKRILPPSRNVYLREMKSLRKAITKLIVDYGDRISECEVSLQEKNLSLERQLVELKSEQERMQMCLVEMKREIEAQVASASRHAAEAVWAEVFANATSDSTWLMDKSLTPGRWALGYPALYALYRILNELHPRRILELGLGQSTRVIGQYVLANEEVEHIVIESNPQWISFFGNQFTVSERTKMIPLELEMRPFKDAESVRSFKGFQEALEGKKFDLIIIDAPLGGDMKQYARIDVVTLLPDCLMDSFVMLIDDAERIGERHTMAEIESTLRKNGIAYAKGRYSGDKDTVVYASVDLRYTCSL